MSVGKIGDRFGPGEGGANAIGEAGGLMPADDARQLLFRGACFAGVFPVHVGAVGTAVDLGDAHVDQVEQGRAERAFVDASAEVEEGFVGF